MLANYVKHNYYYMHHHV